MFTKEVNNRLKFLFFQLLLIKPSIFALMCVTKGRLDKSSYETIGLENGLKSLMIVNPEADKSACALAVRTGSYDDTVPGIAHFLEHMLFMGTEEYPCENDFTDYLSKHNGSSNAYTSDDITVYFFDVDPNFFTGALERFAHFFKTPLFLSDSIDRERQAVDSEYKNSLNNENQRIHRIIQTCFNNEYSQFTIGNNETLNIDGIRDKVMQFWIDNYSSKKMHLTLYHKVNFKEQILNFFGGIKGPDVKDKLAIKTYSGFKPSIIRQDLLRKIVKIVPNNDIKELIIVTELPIERDQYKNNTYGFISFILQKESKNSLINILKTRGFVFDIDINHWNTYTFSMFEISVKLTDLGFKEYLEVIKTISEYLKTMVFEEDEYKKIKATKNWEFLYLENIQPNDLVTELAEAMFYYSPENLLNHDYLYENYCTSQIEFISSLISNPNNWLTCLIGKDLIKENIDFKVEEYFNVKYSIDPENLSFCDRNTNKCCDHGSFLFVYENKYEAPRSSITIVLNCHVTPESYSQVVYYMNMIHQDFIVKYDLDFFYSSVTFDWKILHSGIRLHFYGNNSNLDKCIRLFFDCFKNPNEEYFELVKQLIKTGHIKQKNLPPYKRIMDEFVNHFYKYRFDIDQLMEIDHKITFKDVLIESNFFIDMIVFGNCNKEICLILFNELVRDIGNSKKYIFVEKENPQSFIFQSEDTVNNSVGVFMKCADCVSYEDMACAEILVQNSSELFFDILRTKEALGYIVYNRLFYINNSLYSVFMVQSEKSCEFLKQRIFKFIDDYQNVLKEIDNDEFETLKEAAISAFSEEFKNLNEFARFNLDLYLSNQFDLNYRGTMIKILEKVQRESLKFGGEVIVVEASMSITKK